MGHGERLYLPFAQKFLTRVTAICRISTNASIISARICWREEPWLVKENRPGAASAINATLYERLNFNFIHDIAPVAGIMRIPNVMVVNPSVPAKTVPEFIGYAKSNSGKVNMASPASAHRSICPASCSS